MMQKSSTFDVLGQLAALRRYARALTRDEADAEDLVQDALLRAYEKRSGFDPERGVRGWLFSILHNVFVDRRRARRAEVERENHLAGIEPMAGEPAQEHHVRLAQIRDAFMVLPEEQRSALHLVAIEGLGYAEAAAALGIPQGTLMSRLSRARAALRAVEDGTAAGGRPHLKVVGGPDESSR
ncbi:RNA polymerase sigma-70 factor (ECF subfamily) [Ancylobacter sp. 3268]|uniref:sigma-70 family RNA polymerase sigma factor n=1 Tax=Ancylobacter sp. 3268 TaxID=2817752 RepID=UPI002863A6C5|nr:sigma-70 family RNA polymerase sigma factor [Ancylobacter sp. 3268]MDR6951401.1 RNA polymerase sigma-70 factor (ECF subfamily) [Ancylobacter sp. 3268]